MTKENTELQKELNSIKNREHTKDLRVEDAIAQIYTYLVLANTFVEKHAPINKEIFHLGLILDNIERILFKLDEHYDMITSIKIEDKKG